MEESEKIIIEKTLHQAFIVTVVTNGLVGLADMTVGTIFLFATPISNFLFLMGNHTGIFNTLASLIQHLATHARSTGTFYFFSHGITKLFLAWGLLTNRTWAYPISIVFLGGFSIYQFYTLLLHFSLFVFVLFLLNSIVVLLIGREYRKISHKA